MDGIWNKLFKSIFDFLIVSLGLVKDEHHIVCGYLDFDSIIGGGFIFNIHFLPEKLE